MSKMKFKKALIGKAFLFLIFTSLFLFISNTSMKYLNFKKNNKGELIMNSKIEPNEKNTLILHFTADGRLPYDWYADWIVFDAFIRGVYSTLTHITPNGLFDIDHEDSLLEYIERENGDPSKLILGIKKEQYFEKNGEKKEFTAEDLKFSYSIPFFLKEDDIIEKSDLMKIKGMDKIISGEEYSEDKISGITILNKYALKIELIYPDPDIITNLSTSRYPIVSKYFYQNKKDGEISPGLGKYALIMADKKTGKALLKRKIHVDGYPDYVEFISSENKQGDILWRDMWGNLDKEYKRVIESVPYGTLGMFFNYETTKLGRNKLFRKAIELAINRKILCKEIPYLIPNVQTLPHGYWGRIEVEERQDIKLSKKLISKIQNIPNPFIIEIYGQNIEETQKKYLIDLKEQLKEIGLNPVYVMHTGNEPVKAVIVLTHISVPYKDPKSVFQFFLEGSSFKNTYPKNNKMIKYLFQNMRNNHEDIIKLNYAKKLSQYLYDNKIFIPLWDILSVYIINSNRIETLGDQPGGMLFDIWKVKLKKEILNEK